MRRNILFHQLFLLCTILFIPVTDASACNIPVFRYALERWESDPVELIVFYDDQLTDDELKIVEQLRSQSSLRGENANVSVVLQNVNEIDAPLQPVWQELTIDQKQALPRTICRMQVKRDQRLTIWNRPLDQDSVALLLNSPARTKLAERLLEGDSVVWLVLASGDEQQTEALSQMLREQLPNIAKDIPLPEGIGLPGSELFSPIPLEIFFSVLVIDHDDPQEAFLRELMTRLSPKSYAAGSPLVAPVFGRGRIFDVLDAKAIRPSLLKELSYFLSGACSCQMKELNPGFDLLMNVAWRTELYGDEIPEIPEPLHSRINEEMATVYVEIPDGNELETPAETSAPQIRSSSESVKATEGPDKMLGYRLDWLLLMFISLLVLIVAASSVRMKISDD